MKLEKNWRRRFGSLGSLGSLGFLVCIEIEYSLPENPEEISEAMVRREITELTEIDTIYDIKSRSVSYSAGFQSPQRAESGAPRTPLAVISHQASPEAKLHPKIPEGDSQE